MGKLRHKGLKYPSLPVVVGLCPSPVLSVSQSLPKPPDGLCDKGQTKGALQDGWNKTPFSLHRTCSSLAAPYRSLCSQTQDVSPALGTCPCFCWSLQQPIRKNSWCDWYPLASASLMTQLFTCSFFGISLDYKELIIYLMDFSVVYNLITSMCFWSTLHISLRRMSSFCLNLVQEHLNLLQCLVLSCSFSVTKGSLGQEMQLFPCQFLLLVPPAHLPQVTRDCLGLVFPEKPGDKLWKKWPPCPNQKMKLQHSLQNTETHGVHLKEKAACLEASQEGSVKCGRLSLKTINLIKNPFSLLSA